MPDDRMGDTIAAIATPMGEGGIAVIRVSGADALRIVTEIFSPKKDGRLSDFPSHTIHLGEIRNKKGEVLDQVLVSIFRAPHSYTGEDVLEISSHGGMTVSRRILDLLIQNGARHAEPGEFTKRAFLNGKMDLTQAEAVLDLIKAKSNRSLEVAVRQLAGNLSRKLKNLGTELMKLYAHMEAFLDFPEEDLEIYSDETLGRKLETIRGEITRLIGSFNRGAILREGIVAVVTGKPNVGKSSLFNALLEKDRALVSEFPGTTRDRLEESLEIKGIYVRLVDTAGLIPSADHPLDQMGIERTKHALKEAQLYLYIVDGSSVLEEADCKAFDELEPGKPFLVLINKSGLSERLDRQALERLTKKNDFLAISTKADKGLEAIEEQIEKIILEGCLETGEEQITRLRHKHALEVALNALERSQSAFKKKQSLEFVIFDLKRALDSMSELIGEIYSEDLLDVIFSEFCIGK